MERRERLQREHDTMLLDTEGGLERSKTRGQRAKKERKKARKQAKKSEKEKLKKEKC